MSSAPPPNPGARPPPPPVLIMMLVPPGPPCWRGVPNPHAYESRPPRSICAAPRAELRAVAQRPVVEHAVAVVVAAGGDVERRARLDARTLRPIVMFLTGCMLKDAPMRCRMSPGPGPHSVGEVVAVRRNREAAGRVRLARAPRVVHVEERALPVHAHEAEHHAEGLGPGRGVGGELDVVRQFGVGTHAVDRVVQVAAAQQVAAPTGGVGDVEAAVLGERPLDTRVHPVGRRQDEVVRPEVPVGRRRDAHLAGNRVRRVDDVDVALADAVEQQRLLVEIAGDPVVEVAVAAADGQAAVADRRPREGRPRRQVPRIVRRDSARRSGPRPTRSRLRAIRQSSCR